MQINSRCMKEVVSINRQPRLPALHCNIGLSWPAPCGHFPDGGQETRAAGATRLPTGYTLAPPRGPIFHLGDATAHAEMGQHANCDLNDVSL